MVRSIGSRWRCLIFGFPSTFLQSAAEKSQNILIGGFPLFFPSFFFFSLPRSLGLGRGVRCVCMSGYHVAIRSMQRRRTRKSFVHGQKDNVPNPALISIGSLQSAYYYSVPSVEGVTSRPDDPNSSSEAYSHMNSGCMCHSNIPYSPKGMDPL